MTQDAKLGFPSEQEHEFPPSDLNCTDTTGHDRSATEHPCSGLKAPFDAVLYRLVGVRVPVRPERAFRTSTSSGAHYWRLPLKSYGTLDAEVRARIFSSPSFQ